MKLGIFKYLRKKIQEHTTMTREEDGELIIFKIEGLGFEQQLILPNKFLSMDFAKGLLIDKLVQEPGFLEKLEQVENRKINLKSLLD